MSWAYCAAMSPCSSVDTGGSGSKRQARNLDRPHDTTELTLCIRRMPTTALCHQRVLEEEYLVGST
jgi:hypothetical protein